MKDQKYWHDKPIIEGNDKPIKCLYWRCPYCNTKLKPIDNSTLLCNVCNRFWFFRHGTTWAGMYHSKGPDYS